jgi:hypothetical protein
VPVRPSAPGCNKFDFDWELAASSCALGYDPLEIPVNYESRSFAEGKKVTLIRDATWFRACFNADSQR